MDEDADARLEPLGEFIRDIEHLPEAARHRLALLAGPELVATSDLPAKTVRVLLAANVLHHLGKPERWKNAQEEVEAAASAVVSDWPAEGYAPPQSPWESGHSQDREAFERVSARLKKLEEVARWAEKTIEETGVKFEGDMEEPRFGKKKALRVSVDALLKARDDVTELSADHYSLRKEFARELAPFFPDTRLEPEDSHGDLKNTIRNALEGLRGSSDDA